MKRIDKLYNFWFGGKFIFPNGMLILITFLLIGALTGSLAYKMNRSILQILAFMSETVFICLIGLYTIGLIILKDISDKKTEE